jgi:hypothetical protein
MKEHTADVVFIIQMKMQSEKPGRKGCLTVASEVSIMQGENTGILCIV